jgi:hypothetical protein
MRKMENKEISNYSELVLHIMHLKQEKFRQEEEIKYNIRELIFLLNPIYMFKQGLRGLASDSEAKFDLAKVGLDMGISILVNGLLRNRYGIKGMIGKLILEKFSSTVIGNNLSKIVTGIRNRFHRPTPFEINQQ